MSEPARALRERALPRVRIPDQRDGGDLVAVPLPRGRRAALDVGQVGLDLLDLLADQAPVRLELALARSPSADPAARAQRWVQRRVRRGRWYSSAASSTCRRPSFVRAWRQDVDDQRRAVNRPCSRGASRGCAAGSARARRRRWGLKSVADCSSTSSAARPLPSTTPGRAGPSWTAEPTTVAPAVSAKAPSSSSERSPASDHREDRQGR